MRGKMLGEDRQFEQTQNAKKVNELLDTAQDNTDPNVYKRQVGVTLTTFVERKFQIGKMKQELNK
eukprot:2302285-Ditylum_brightwellii.AAC.1